VKEFEPDYKTIQEYKEEIENFESLYLEAKQIADKLFEEYFDLMCHIVNAEAGISISSSSNNTFLILFNNPIITLFSYLRIKSGSTISSFSSYCPYSSTICRYSLSVSALSKIL